MVIFEQGQKLITFSWWIALSQFNDIIGEGMWTGHSQWLGQRQASDAKCVMLTSWGSIDISWLLCREIC